MSDRTAGMEKAPIEGHSFLKLGVRYGGMGNRRSAGEGELSGERVKGRADRLTFPTHSP